MLLIHVNLGEDHDSVTQRKIQARSFAGSYRGQQLSGACSNGAGANSWGVVVHDALHYLSHFGDALAQQQASL